MKLMFSLNYFGVTGLAYGIYDLLKKKGGSCVVIVSNTISQGGVHMDLCDMLNYACNQDRNEARILSILEQYDGSNMTMAQGLYATTKYALARWVRRISASWGANGVRINAVAPGNVRTPLTAAMATALRRRWRDFRFPSTIRPRPAARPRGHRQCAGVSGVPGGPRRQRQHHVCRRRHRRSAQQRKSLLRRRNP